MRSLRTFIVVVALFITQNKRMPRRPVGKRPCLFVQRLIAKLEESRSAAADPAALLSILLPPGDPIGDAAVSCLGREEVARLAQRFGVPLDDDSWAHLLGDCASKSNPDAVDVPQLCFVLSHGDRKRFAERARGKKGDENPKGGDAVERTAAALGNCGFLEYYTTQLHLSGDELQTFISVLSVPLPMSIRVHRSTAPSRLVAPALTCSSYIPQAALGAPKLFGPSFRDTVLGTTNAAYHDPQNRPLVTACKVLHGAGLCCFQEVVSMLPVAALDVRPWHSTLDLCAAPGGKTFQAADSMMRTARSGTGWAAEGVIWANEKCRVKATQELPSRTKKYRTPNVIITRCDATALPSLLVDEPTETLPHRFLFDRIICDVPCSGDGTMRKDRTVMSTWSLEYAKNLATVQKQLLQRAIDLLKPGGMLTYSTCSLNPIEDEEVLIAVLSSHTTPQMTVVDVNAVLHDRGLRLTSRGGLLVDGDSTTLELRKTVQRSTLRMQPHLNDTGGFFLALLKRPLESTASPIPGDVSKCNRWVGGKQFRHVDEARDEDWLSIRSFFGVRADPTGPFRFAWHLSPDGGSPRRLLLLSRGVYDLAFRTLLYKGPGVELVAMGARMFEKIDDKFLPDCKCRWRPTYEACEYLAAVCDDSRKIRFARDDNIVVELLTAGSTPVSAIQSVGANVPVGGVLVGIAFSLHPNSASGANSEIVEWWFSAMLTTSKLELTCDQGIRRAALMLYTAKVPEIAEA